MGVIHAQEIPYNYTPEKPQYRNPDSKFYADTTVNKKRTWAVCGLAFGTYGAVYTGLGAAWYANQATSSFRWFEDLDEWKQVDKTGHVLGGYLGSAYTIRMMKWAGHKKSTAVWVGGLTGFLMVNTIEVFDGFSPAYGASPSDIGFNALGSLTAVANELLWNEQRLQWKISYHPTDWHLQRPDLLGTGVERLVKDYNGHTFWMSARVHSFLPEGKFKQIYPRWLNVAVGYGAEGLIGGWGDPDPAVQAAIREREYRQFYLSFDIDLSMIKTKSPFLDFLLGTINFIHIPMPALEMSRKGVRFRPVFM